MEDPFDDKVYYRPEQSKAVLVYRIRSLRPSMKIETISLATPGVIQNGSPILFDLCLLPPVSSLAIDPH